MASDTVKARWAAGFHALLADGREIAPGDEVEVGRDEAEASDNWEVRDLVKVKPSPVREDAEAVS